MIRDIIKKDAPILSQRATAINFDTERDQLLGMAADIADTVQYLLTTHEFSKGIGLAAPQIGFSKRVFGFAPPAAALTIYINP